MSITNKAALGSKITVQEKGADDREVYVLASSTNIMTGQLGPDNPMGKALMGAAVGETVKVEGPGGVIHFEVLALESAE